ncbi:hypothetical protein AVEN_80174-1 [Araneus ventricosus]|uniref:Uncharacterized protein n=1 Tax=Araneus ventricosus TaxID=182803 RepID=A0A4Y2QL22_ARAVE|nr:hypothetical protein AVEN_80174-1 [Araneus ventricosus]
MEKHLSYVSKLSLQEMALRRVAVVLWSDSDILASIGKFRFRYDKYQKEWQETIEGKVADKVSKLQLPESLKKQMMQILKPIGLQILRWKMFHEAYVSNSSANYDVPILAKLCWTTSGAVDYQKTAEKLIRSDVVDIVKRYILACLYCMEDCIPEFWKELPEEHKTYFYVEDSTPIEEPHLEFCWPYILEGKESKLDDMPGRRGGPTRFHRYAFEYSAHKGNKAAAEYFFQKLTHEEREATLIRTAQAVVSSRNMDLYRLTSYHDFPKEKVSDVLCYLLSLMTQEEQIRIFNEQPCEVLKCFLDWPLQDFFLDIADFIWTFLPERDYSSLLWNMTRSIQNTSYYFPNLFQNFFLRSPINFRKHFVDRECQFGSFFPEFFNIEDTETIKVIFRNVDTADRVRLVSSEHVFKLFYNFILRGRWRIVEVCLLEATLSKEDKERLKKDFMEFLKEMDRGQIKWRKRKWRRFFEFLDGKDARAHRKRSMEDETLTKAKKLCCEGLGSCTK